MNTKIRSAVLGVVMAQGVAGNVAAQQSDVRATQEITRAGTQASTAGPADLFTGRVRVDPLWAADAAINSSGAWVTFEPGARSNWHSHPIGQRLVVISGQGLIQEWGKPVQVIRPGDVVVCPPGVKHWHGAGPTTAMTHLAVTGTVDGKNATWMEKVSDEQYDARPTAPMNDLRSVAPALDKYRQGVIADLWKRPDLSPRDRSIVTVAALIARNNAVEMPEQFGWALDNGVKPSELSEIITHLAFYSGWGNAMSAAQSAREIFLERRIGVDQLPEASPKPLPLDEGAEAKRAAGVSQQFGATIPGMVQYTTDVLFRDLWLRPGLAPRDRSLVTVSALVASGQVAQITYHLNRAMDNGLTQPQAAEALTHLAFYAGWPNVFSAMPVAKDVFEKRAK